MGLVDSLDSLLLFRRSLADLERRAHMGFYFGWLGIRMGCHGPVP